MLDQVTAPLNIRTVGGALERRTLDRQSRRQGRERSGRDKRRKEKTRVSALKVVFVILKETMETTNAGALKWATREVGSGDDDSGDFSYDSFYDDDDDGDLGHRNLNGDRAATDAIHIISPDRRGRSGNFGLVQRESKEEKQKRRFQERIHRRHKASLKDYETREQELRRLQKEERERYAGIHREEGFGEGACRRGFGLD